MAGNFWSIFWCEVLKKVESNLLYLKFGEIEMEESENYFIAYATLRHSQGKSLPSNGSYGIPNAPQ